MRMHFSLPDLSALWPHLLAGVPVTVMVLIGMIALRALTRRLLTLFARRSRLRAVDVAPFGRIINWVITISALLLIFSAFGLNLGGFWGVVSTVFAMVAVGFIAAWSILSNSLCTVLILVYHPFAIGDVVEFPGEPTRGEVVDLNFLYTTLRGEDGADFQVPNNMFFQKVLKRRRGMRAAPLADQLKRPAPAA